MKTFSVIVACSLNGGIGNNNTIPWYIPDDLRHFKTITTSCPDGFSNVVIMGKNTWNSLPKKPLPNRINIVISSTLGNEHQYENTFIVSSLDNALSKSVSFANIHNVFVIGGCKVYNEALEHPLCEKVYVTHILKHIQCSVLFPLAKLYDTFPVCHEGSINNYNDFSYTFCLYTKK
jgi:dihydrofolate reductase